MLITVQEFRARIYDDLDVMLSELERHSGRGSPNERVAWRNSLPTLAEVLNHDVAEVQQNSWSLCGAPLEFRNHRFQRGDSSRAALLDAKP